ncbi:MAG: hypothetical protein JW852_02130 [Spirochaetales bacterium]|nr:hypothetical protein [Spirochaetales bacterium]
MTETDLQFEVTRKLHGKLRNLFGRETSYSEGSTLVDFDGNHLTITLRGALNSAERYYANTENNRVFLENLYGRHLSFLKHDFQRDFSTLLRKTSTDMNVVLVPEQGDVKVTLLLLDM